MKPEIPKDFRYIPSFPDYCVDRCGQNVVKVFDDGTTRVLSKNSKSCVVLFKDGKRYCRSSFQLMREAWFNNPLPNGRFKISVSALNVQQGSTKWIRYDSMTEASKATGVPIKYISEILNTYAHHTAYGWAFRREDWHV